MGKYLLRRLLIFIPTLFIITLLAFMISVSAPGDPVDSLLNVAEQGGMSGSNAVTEKLRQQKRQELGLDLPLFYFSLGTAADIDTIYRVPDREEQAMLKRLARETGNPYGAVAYYAELKNLHQSHQTVSLDSADLNTHAQQDVKDVILRSEYIINTLLNAINSDDATAKLDTLTVLYAEYSSLSPLTDELNQVQEAHEKLLDNKNLLRVYIPSLQWYGLNNQYHLWLSNVIKGDFGISYRDQQPVVDRLWDKFKWSFFLTLFATVLAYLISIPVGVYAAYKRGSFFDRASAVVLFILYSLPSFFLGTLLLVLFANPDFFNWFPEAGVQDPVMFDPEWSFWQKVKHWTPYLVLPLIAYTYGSLAFLSRQMRTGMLEVAEQDFIRTARAKGLPERKVIWKHVFRNALLPIITVFATVFPMAVGGSVIIETIFSIPGMGREIYDSIIGYDYPMIVAIFFIFGVMTLIGYLVSDILYALVDPRISFNKNN